MPAPTPGPTASTARATGRGRTARLAGLAVLGTILAGVIALASLVALVAGAGILPPAWSGPGTGAGGWSGGQVPPVPPAMLSLYHGAAATCPGLSWAVLAAIGTVESDNGQSSLAGVHAGANAAGAEGPMQFEPATFAEYAEPVPAGGAHPPSPYDPADAVYAAARMLCADGARGGVDVAGAVFAYDHDAGYVTEVLTLAERLQGSAPSTAHERLRGGRAVRALRGAGRAGRQRPTRVRTYIGIVADDPIAGAVAADPTPREMWHLLEVLHAVVYFAPEPIAIYKEIGLRGYWMGYFASRSAAMGAVSAAVVDATFYNFAPRLVHRAIPDAWGYASPDRVLQARVTGAGATLTRIVGEADGGPPAGASRAVGLLREAVADLDCAGRPLAAAHAAIAVPDDPLQALWHLATVVREHRGDGHVALLVGSEIGACEAHVLHVAAGATTRPTLQSARGWEDVEWDAAEQVLVDRGWIDAGGGLTVAGRDARARIEQDTDRLAAGPWHQLGPERTAELAGLLATWVEAVRASDTIPPANPMVLPIDGAVPGTP